MSQARTFSFSWFLIFFKSDKSSTTIKVNTIKYSNPHCNFHFLLSTWEGPLYLVEKICYLIYIVKDRFLRTVGALAEYLKPTFWPAFCPYKACREKYFLIYCYEMSRFIENKSKMIIFVLMHYVFETVFSILFIK